MLQALHASRKPEYDRVVLVAHSLGGFIAYDAIAYLWGHTNADTDKTAVNRDLATLKALEQAASALPDTAPKNGKVDPAVSLGTGGATRASGRRSEPGQPMVDHGLRQRGHPDVLRRPADGGQGRPYVPLAGSSGASCPRAHPRTRSLRATTLTARSASTPGRNVWSVGPRGERQSITHRILYEGAPFAVVRWTNLYFPAGLGFFGDWFGGPLAPVFGTGIKDVAVTGNKLGSPGTNLLRHRKIPAAAHSYYFRFPGDDEKHSIAYHVRTALDLASTSWLRPDQVEGSSAETKQPGTPPADVAEQPVAEGLP